VCHYLKNPEPEGLPDGQALFIMVEVWSWWSMVLRESLPLLRAWNEMLRNGKPCVSREMDVERRYAYLATLFEISSSRI